MSMPCPTCGRTANCKCRREAARSHTGSASLDLHTLRRFLAKADARCSALVEAYRATHPVAQARAEEKANKTASEYESARTDLLSLIERLERA